MRNEQTKIILTITSHPFHPLLQQKGEHRIQLDARLIYPAFLYPLPLTYPNTLYSLNQK